MLYGVADIYALTLFRYLTQCMFCSMTSVYVLIQVSVVGLSYPFMIQMTPLMDNFQYIYQFGLPHGRYRIEWDFIIARGYAFVRKVSYTNGSCNNTGMFSYTEFDRLARELNGPNFADDNIKCNFTVERDDIYILFVGFMKTRPHWFRSWHCP